MKETIKTKTVNYTVYQTSDGKEFENKEIAQLHEDELSGKKKLCTQCNGKGRINERWENEYLLKTGEHFATEKTPVLKSDICPTCNGKKYLELKWV